MKIVYRLNSNLYTATSIETLPARIDRLIAFYPDCPPHPHTAEQHAEMTRLGDMLLDILDREGE